MEGWILYKEHYKDGNTDVHEINRFFEIAEQRNIDLKVYAPNQFDLIVTRDDRKSIHIDGEIKNLPDFLLPRMGANTTYFALAVIRQIERLGVRTINTSDSVEIAKDKLYTQQILAQSNLPVPKTMLAKYPVDSNIVEKHLGFPVVVKTLVGSQGSGVYLSDNKSDFEDIMQLISSTNPNVNIILQEYIKSSRGRDIRVFVIGGRAIACMERIAKDGGFAANYSKGGDVKNFEMTPEIEWLATESSRILNLDIAGIDLLFDGEHFKICEANSSPGFKGIEKVCDVSIPDEIYNFIKIRLGKY